MPYSRPEPYKAPETTISVVTQTTEPTVNHQKVDMKSAGNVGGNRPRMLPQNTRSNASFV